MRAMSFMSGRRHLLLYRGNNLFYLDCREADESRLRELCENFLGPPTGMTDAVSSDPKDLKWDPCVLVRLLVPLLHCHQYFQILKL